MYVYVYANIEMIYMNGSGIFLLTKIHSCTSTGPKAINVLIPTNQRERERAFVERVRFSLVPEHKVRIL